MTLTAKDVEDYVKTLVFMPGWTFSVSAPFGEHDSYRQVMIHVTMPDTSNPPHYDKLLPYPFDWAVAIEAGSHHDVDSVGFKVLRKCVAILTDEQFIEHEAREYFRTDNGNELATDARRYRAPFHPHRFSGVSGWNEQLRLQQVKR